jgi:hypothetical protein
MLNIFLHLEDLSSHHLSATVEDRLPKNSGTKSRIKFRSKSLDDLIMNRPSQSNDDQSISNTTRTEMDLSGIGCPINKEIDNLTDNYLQPPTSQSAPVSPTKIHDKEFDAFIQNEQQQLIADNFVYNIDLSDTNESTHQPHSRREIFFVSLSSNKDSLIKTNHKEKDFKVMQEEKKNCQMFIHKTSTCSSRLSVQEFSRFFFSSYIH